MLEATNMPTENIITLGSSSEEEKDDDVLPIVLAPPLPPGPKIGISTLPKRGTQIVHLAASTVGPKLQPRHITPVASYIPKINGVEDDVVIVLSSDDEDESLPKSNGLSTSSSQRRRGQKGSVDDEQPSTSAACKLNPGFGSDSKTDSNGSSSATHLKDENNDEDAQDVLKDEDLVEEPTDEVVAESPCTAAADNINKLLTSLNTRLTANDRKRLKIKLEKKYEKLGSQPLNSLNELSKRIDLVRNQIVENPDFNVWKLLKQLLEQFKPDVLNNGKIFTISFPADEQKKIEDKKEKRKRHLEYKLKKVSKFIKRLDEMETNWDSDDEQNSAFMQRARLMKRCMLWHNEICKIDKCSKLTGRPIQKAFNLKNTTTYPEVELAVEKYVNSNGYFQAPSFAEILDVVETSNIKSSLHLAEPDRRELAQTLHRAVIDRRQQLRELDVPLAYPSECGEANLNDPADADPELEEKLKQNAKTSRSIKSVVDEFAERQQMLDTASKRVVDNDEGTTERNCETENYQDQNEGDDEEEEEEEEDEEDLNDGSDTASTAETPPCFVTSAEEEAESLIEAWKEPLFNDEDESDETIDEQSECSPVETATASNITDTETIPLKICNGNQIPGESINGTELSEPLGSSDTTANDGLPPPPKRLRTDNAHMELAEMVKPEKDE